MASEPTPTRGHKKRARTRQRLVDAGLSVFSEHGAAMTVQQIVEEAGVSHGTFYNYFKDVDALIEAIALHVFSSVAAAVAASGEPDPARRFASATAQTLRLLTDNPSWARSLLRLVAQPHLGEVMVGHMRADLLAGRASGRFTQNTDEIGLDIFCGMLLSCVVRINAGQHAVEPWSPQRAQQVITRMLSLLGIPLEEAAALVADVT